MIAWHIWYLIAYIIAVLSCGVITYFTDRMLRGRSKQEVSLVDLFNDDLLNVFGKFKKSIADKKSVFLVKLAKSGFIRIRKDANEKIYIDKLRDFEALNDNLKSIISEVFSNNVSYYGDENAIMSYETVSWDDAKERYRHKIDELTQDIKDINNDIKITKKDSKWKNPLRRNVYIMWLIGLFPLGISYAYASGDASFYEIALEVFAIYFMAGVEYLVFCAAYGALKAIKKFLDNLVGLPAVINGLLKTVGYFMIVTFACMIIMLFVYAAATVAICEEMYTVPLNVILAILLCLSTAYALMYNKFGKNKDSENHNISYDRALSKNNIRKLVHTKEEYDKAVLYAYMFDKMKEFKNADIEEQDMSDWYEGFEGQSEEELMLQLDAK